MDIPLSSNLIVGCLITVKHSSAGPSSQVSLEINSCSAFEFSKN
mgnify:CR=1 FL=1